MLYGGAVITENKTKDNILSAGKDEFLKKGFADASLRNIAMNAGVTTGAIYGYYPDKEALFSALVEPAAEEFTDQFLKAHRGFDELEEGKIDLSFEYSTNSLRGMVDYIYENFDSFRLLIGCAHGTSYEDYIEYLVKKEDEATIDFANILRKNGYSVKPVSNTMVHILSKAFFSALFEIVAHNMEKSEAVEYVDHIVAFFRAGWRELFGSKQE